MAGKTSKEKKKTRESGSDTILAELALLRQDIETLKETRVPLAALSPAGAPVVSPERVAQRAAAFTPAARARLAHALLLYGAQTPAQLGEAAGLSTGSLYHHLREIVTSGVASVHDKTYQLTPEGERLARALFGADSVASP